MLVRAHEAFVDRPFRTWATALVTTEALFFVLTLFSDLAEHWPIAVYQLLGIAAIAIAVRRHEASQPGDRFLLLLGALAAVAYLYTFAPWLGYLALVAWGIIVLVSIVA